MATREDLVRIARETVAGPYRPDTSESFNPLRFDPPEWVLEAMRAAYERGVRDGRAAEVEPGERGGD